MLRKVTLIVSLAAVLLVGTDIAAAREGVLACIGKYYPVMLDDRGSVTNFTLSNFNDAATITINRIVIYGMGGQILCDSADPELDVDVTTPPFVVGMDLPPNGTQWFTILAGDKTVNNNYCLDTKLQVTQNYNIKIYWSYSGILKTPLYGEALREFHNIDNVRIAAASWECIIVKLK